MRIEVFTALLVLAAFGFLLTYPLSSTAETSIRNVDVVQRDLPSVYILSPGNGATVKSTAIGVTLNVTNFQLRGIANQPNANGEGHFHVYLDGQEKMSSIKSLAFTNVQPGLHVLRVELRNNDHTPLNPPVFSEIFVTTE